ncbi:MAG: helicase-associated domain-containing protein, partial [Pseudonocardiaceae bacterium]
GTLTWDAAVMPREVGLALRGGRPFAESRLVPPALATGVIDQPGIDQQGVEAALRLVDDLQSLLEDWGSNPPTLLRDGGLGVREIRRAAKFLDRPERDAASILELVGVVGLAGVDWEEGLALPSSAYDRWIEWPTPQRWAWVADRWRGSGYDLGVAGAISGRDKVIPALLNRSPDPGAAARRSHYLSLLADLPDGQGAQAGSLFARIDWERPGTWSLGPVGTPVLFEWVVYEAEVLGVVAGGGLTSAGRFVAAGLQEQASKALAAGMGPEISTVLFQADLTAIAPARLLPSIRTEMELMANVESSGVATVYRLSETTLRRAFDAGRSAEEIAEFLRQHAARGVPQTLEYLVADLGRRHGRMMVGPARSVI